MSEHFVTLFDHKFLPQGLALHSSLVEHCEDFVLWILCLDSQVERKLKDFRLINVRLLSLDFWRLRAFSSFSNKNKSGILLDPHSLVSSVGF